MGDPTRPATLLQRHALAWLRQQGRPVSPGELAAYLWPDRKPAARDRQAGNTLRILLREGYIVCVEDGVAPKYTIEDT